MVFQAFSGVFITTQQNVSLLTPYSVLFLIYNAIYSVLLHILSQIATQPNATPGAPFTCSRFIECTVYIAAVTSYF